MGWGGWRKGCQKVENDCTFDLDINPIFLSKIDIYPGILENPMSTSNHWFIRARLKTRAAAAGRAAEEGNIHRAAQVLSMTQPAASKLLRT